MGSLLSKKDEEKLNDAINRSLHAEGKKLKNEVKLLLLGMLFPPSSPSYLSHHMKVIKQVFLFVVGVYFCPSTGY